MINNWLGGDSAQNTRQRQTGSKSACLPLPCERDSLEVSSGFVEIYS